LADSLTGSLNPASYDLDNLIRFLRHLLGDLKMNFNTNNTIGSGDTKSTRSRNSAPVVESVQPAPVNSQPAIKTSSDQVLLSQEAQKLGQLQAKINASPDVNLEKVNEIRKAIAEGKFHVNPERIAEALLNQEELLG
jgi:negative regulator of flagellin synthesis FlgM